MQCLCWHLRCCCISRVIPKWKCDEISMVLLAACITAWCLVCAVLCRAHNDSRRGLFSTIPAKNIPTIFAIRETAWALNYMHDTCSTPWRVGRKNIRPEMVMVMVAHTHIHSYGFIKTMIFPIHWPTKKVLLNYSTGQKAALIAPFR